MPVSPERSHLEVKQAILESADQIYALQGKCVTGGRLNLYNAVDYKPPLLDISMVDDIDCPDGCVVPSDLINYTIFA